MKTAKCGWFLAVVTVVGLLSLSARAQWRAIGNVDSAEKTANGVEIRAGMAKLQVSVLSANLVRLRYAPDGTYPEDHSFAVLPGAYSQGAKFDVSDAADAVTVNAGAVQVRVEKAPMRVVFLDEAGAVVNEDRPGYPVSFDGTSFRVWKTMPAEEHYFGLGDKTGPLDHRDIAFTMWNKDQFGWQESTDPLYKDVPFFLGVQHGKAYGIFLDNTYRTSFDFGKEFRDAYSFGSDGGELNYYFFYGPDPKRVVADFTQLTGRVPLPPLFALGFQQSRYSYYPESQVRQIAGEFRKRKIPVDVLYLDIDYQDRNRPFTVDPERFPHFGQMVQDLKKEGFKLVLITDLHIAKVPGYKPYDEGEAHGYFVKNPDGSDYVGPVWPGESVFPDFTRQEVRDWFGTLYTDFVKMGVRGFWNDMNEPAVFTDKLATPNDTKTMPLDTVHSVEGRKTDHREIHNVFGMENVRASHDGLLKLQPDVRPFVLTRAAYAGTQRYAATWTGDNTASWNHMRLSIPQLINLGISGFGYAGADIGGFNGSPTPDLLTRWMELGVFNTFYRNHAAKGTRFREPWVDGPEHEKIRKRYIETRYRLLPYIYTGIEEMSRTGVPMMRPMFMDYPAQANLATNGEEYMFGDAFLVAPKVWPFLDPYDVILPPGDWFDYWTGAKVAGDTTLKANPPLDTLPVYVRAGSIIPQQPVVQNTGETPQGPLELRVYAGPNCHGDLYQDDGNTFAYQKGQFLREHFTCEVSATGVKVTLAAAEGSFQPWFKTVQLTVIGAGSVRGVKVDGQAVKDWKSQGDTTTLGQMPWTAAAHEVEFASGGR
jgi:alpha-glucosidase